MAYLCYAGNYSGTKEKGMNTIHTRSLSRKSYALCPVSDKWVNERVSRINGAITGLLLIIFGLTQNVIPVAFLALDFVLRASDYAKYSLITRASKGLARCLPPDEHLINAGPKIFAARIGLIFCSLIILTAILDASIVAGILAGALVLFSLLETAFGFCVACEIYPLVYKALHKNSFQGGAGENYRMEPKT
jgi:hypothetical protein